MPLILITMLQAWKQWDQGNTSLINEVKWGITEKQRQGPGFPYLVVALLFTVLLNETLSSFSSKSIWKSLFILQSCTQTKRCIIPNVSLPLILNYFKNKMSAEYLSVLKYVYYTLMLFNLLSLFHIWNFAYPNWKWSSCFQYNKSGFI